MNSSDIITIFFYPFSLAITYYFSATAILALIYNFDSKLLDWKYDKYTDSEEENEPEYRIKYNDKLEKLEFKDLSEELLENINKKTIEDNTPLGIIILEYDKDFDGFKYFSNTRDVPYYILETISRKFVIEYDCKCLYINLKEHMDELKEKEKKMKEINESKKDDDAYVNIDKEIVDSIFTKSKYREKKINKKTIIKEKIINFKYGGLLIDLKENKIKNDNKDVKNISFKEFKEKNKLE
jgi:hypothetical protein